MTMQNKMPNMSPNAYPDDITLTGESLLPHDLSHDPVLLNAGWVMHQNVSVKALGGIPLYWRLGNGSHGTVYYGKHPRLNRDVAVKVMRSDEQDNDKRINVPRLATMTATLILPCE